MIELGSKQTACRITRGHETATASGGGGRIIIGIANDIALRTIMMTKLTATMATTLKFLKIDMLNAALAATCRTAMSPRMLVMTKEKNMHP
jgi:hypothetical protein